MFAQYGVAVATTAPATAEALRALPDDVMAPAVDAMLKDSPEPAALGEQRLREILAEVTAAHLARTSTEETAR
ncbi:hypothetical protein [Actinophytocola oryzae]|uniref:Uncharacterized protein n=1 Tax=Actinophytocola oryzae TaxID=502181 RepID=A0A4R7W4U4_9PSEU|nr:hypothetical protein [Actinophytocola oryzae]TDV57624.1 hypothetical protein CLV71_101497 [Actinophytocola oryzae]